MEFDATPRVFLIDAVTPDVSSTMIRARLATGEPLAGLVPEPVAAFIARRRLYEPASRTASAPPADSADSLHD